MHSLNTARLTTYKRFDTVLFPLKVWITSVLVGPFLLLSLSTQPTLLTYIFSSGFLEFYFVAVVIGGGVSIPCFLLLWLCTQMLMRWKWRTATIRVSLLVISLLCCITIFSLFSLPDISSIWKPGNVKLMGAYALPLTFGVMVYKLEKQKAQIDK
jgi:hypothetical protein